jgi:diguanylate cyclase (GGDEF)-like protein
MIIEKEESTSLFFKFCVAALAFILVSGVAFADFATDYKTSISLLYLVPIILAVWYSWGIIGYMLAILGGSSDSILTIIFNQQHGGITTLNSVTQSIFFLAFAYLLTARKKMIGRLKLLSRTDPLTELVNSRYFFEVGNIEIERAFRYKHPFSLVYIDMDDFKKVNDTLGHSAGDALLREVASKVRSTIRKTDMMARLGGDEFAVLLPETDVDNARSAVKRIQASLTGIKIQKPGPVTFSIGVVTNTGHPCPFDEMISEADSLMYEAKRSGKNAVREKVITG